MKKNMSLINVMGRAQLGQIVKAVPFIEGAEVTFLNDVPGDFAEQLSAKSKELGDQEAGYWSATQTIVDWNFADEAGNKLPISAESIKKLSVRLQRFLFTESSKAVFPDEETKKGLPANS